MTLDFLPPQAYTKETLLKAYNWLQSQSDQVKEYATTPDQLVSLYLKSGRVSSDTLQRMAPIDPPSLQNFKSELKNLAGLMGDLEKPQIYTPPPQQASSPTSQQQQNPPPNTYVPASQASVSTVAYDEMTQSLIREVKNELNLSTDIEALRMLVKIGYQKVRSLYK